MGSSNRNLIPGRIDKKSAIIPTVTLSIPKKNQESEGNGIPEGPELKRSADVLNEHLAGKRLISLGPRKTGRYRDKPPVGQAKLAEELQRGGPIKIKEITVKGKFMWWEFDVLPEPWFMFCTYGMSGQWSWHLTKYTTYSIEYQDDGPDRYVSVHFNDIRNFGTLKFVEGRKALEKKLASLGPDMLSDPPGEEEFLQILRKRDKKTLAEVIMNQGVISGVGNYIKCESLYAACLDPNALIKDVSDEDLDGLRGHIIHTMRTSYENNGATFSTYQNPDGSSGEAPRRFACYGQKADPDGHPVEKIKTNDGRTTHWVPAVQRR
jgi:formamidopyrimidine-DNA glycosylase